MSARAAWLPIWLGLTLGSGELAAQAALTIRERTPAGHTLDVGGAGIVDINSTLLIGIDRERIRQLAGQEQEATQAITELLSRLESVTRVRNSALAGIAPALAAWESSGKDDSARVALQGSLQSLTRAASTLIDAAPRGSRLRERLNAALGVAITRRGGLEDLYGTVLAAAAEEAATLRLERDSLLAVAGVFVQAGGWSLTDKGTRPLHFPGFDTNPNLEAFDVETFGIGVIALNKAQKRELARAADVARAFNEGGASAAFSASSLRNAFGEAILPLIEQGIGCIAAVRETAEGLVGPDAPEAISSDLQPALGPLEEVRSFVLGLREKYRSDAGAQGTAAEFLISSTEDLAGVFRRIDAAKTALVAMHTSLAERVPGGAFAARVNALRGSARSCADALQTDLVSTRAAAEALVRSLTGVREINADILEFTESVLRLDVDQVPERVDFRLRYAGERKDGDRILVRLLVGGAEDRAPSVEDHELTMFRVQPHLETVVGLVFGDPLGSSDLSARFQAAPAYSVLLKRGSRKSEMRNRLLILGLGLNVAAFDFDHDDNLELAVGGVFSFLGDYLQGGVGYNIPQDRGYWFFGLRLPLPTFTLPGAGGVDSDSELWSGQ
jgi:hypothetical protein